MSADCVRVEPPRVTFRDVRVGQVYKTTVTVTNAGNKSNKIIIQKPATKFFRFTVLSPAVVVAPGLSVSGVLEFTPEEEEEVKDCLLVHVNDEHTLEIPLLGTPRTCSLFMDSEVDFGCIAASGQLVSKHHPIINQGSAPGVFQVQYNGDSSLTISPCSGVVGPGATQWLKVKLRADRPRHIFDQAEVTLQNRSAVVLIIKADVMDQHLEIFDLQGNLLNCLWLGPVYFGTSCVENVVLRNSSPKACDWVCVIQSSAAGSEVGTDLQRSADAALLERMKNCSPASHDVSQVLACIPKQGKLGPFGKTTVAVRFSPVSQSVTGEKKRGTPFSRQDYCLFLLFESVGSKHGFTHHHANSSAELAITGSGLPVSLVPSPSDRFDFLSCTTGQHVDLLCVLQNHCAQLPVSFSFRKVAHFSTEPSSGTIGPGQSQDVVLSFNARQQGSFQVHQKLDVLGYVVCKRDDGIVEDVAELELRSFHAVTLHFSAVCHSETTHRMPKINPLSSFITSPLHVKRSELAHCRQLVRAAVLSADKTRLHKHRRGRSTDTEEEEFLAFPNDRASSIRPASPNTQYRTIFTGLPRYRYLDTDYAYTKEEEEQRQRVRQIYADFTKQLRQTRLRRIKERQQEKLMQDVDIGIVPGQGLVPPSLCISNMIDSEDSESNKPKTASVTQQLTNQIPAVMNAVPSTNQEVADCNRTLTAQELYQVIIGPLSVDFGEVCVKSVCVQNLELVNNLSVHIWIQLEVDFPELQGSSPMSHVLPPHSRSALPLTFQSNKLGPFYGLVSYSVNQQHPGQILVQAQVVPLALEISTNLLVIHPTPGLLAASGYRSSVTLRNQRNRAAEFTWRPVVTESGILFSVRPATGVVEPGEELDCEVVWDPSFFSPSEGDFDLCVHEGNTQRLHCVAKVGAASVQLAEKRVTFTSVPLNLPSTRTAVLQNTGQNHAYYQVLDVCPMSGMRVSPSEGTVPSRGQAVLKINFIPDCVVKFDTTVEIALRNMKSIEMRVGGSVELPNVDISVSHFQFYGVYAGSQRVIPFVLTNRSSAVACVTFDLSEHNEFSVGLPQPSTKRLPGVSVVEVQGFQTLDYSLVFSPNQMASYDFDLSIIVNGVRWPCASTSPSTTTTSLSISSSLAAGSRKHTVVPLSHAVTMATQRCPRVQATVLCAPLEISPSSLQFEVEPQSDTLTQKVELEAACEGSVCWRAFTGDRVRWWFDCSAIAARAENRSEGELCTMSPSSGSLGPGESVSLMVSITLGAIGAGSERVIQLSLPLYLGDTRGEEMGGYEGREPYRELSITITLQVPTITIHPPIILLQPVPLRTNAEATLTLLADGYPRGTSVSAEVDEVKLEDGTEIQPVSIIFPEGNTIPAEDLHQQETSAHSLMCTVEFSSAIPLSLCTTITFSDHLHNRFQVQLYANTENCLLTVWPYMALHYFQQQIVLKTGTMAVETILQRYHTPSPASGPTSSSASSFDHNSSTNKNSDSFPDSDSVSRSASRDTDDSAHRDSSASLGVPEFPAANTEEGLYHQNVLLAVERWFSFFGWPSGMHPITVPHTLRSTNTNTDADQSSGRAHRVSQNKNSRSVVDMLQHLTGREIPGIPRCQTLSTDIEQRTNQLLQWHKAMLDFLRVQGASLCHIRPQYLLDALEFKHWCSQQSNNLKQSLNYSSVDYESLSKRSWTDVLLQIFKVLVLCRVSEKDVKTTLDHKHSDEFVTVASASNIYSSRELQLLSWLNVHYHSMREKVWGTGGVPSARWIVNFDLDLADGLVLAALLAAYCPYLITSHFRRMYSSPSSLEQILHNNIIVAQALTTLRLNINIQPTDLSDPNPVQMLILCLHLYEKLPQYVPVHTITLSGGLHSTLSKQVRVKNPSTRSVRYKALLLGEDAPLFCLPDGSTVTIPPKSSKEVTVHFSCSFLESMEAVLVLISSPVSGLCCATLTFALKTHITHITPTNTVECQSPCYQLEVIHVPLTNMFYKEAKFRVVLVESVSNPLEPETTTENLFHQASSRVDMEKMYSHQICAEQTEDSEGSEFLSAVRDVYLKPGQAATLRIHYLPFCPGTKHCSVLLVSLVGDMVYMVKATSQLPHPSPLTAKPSVHIESIPQNSATAVCVSVLRLRCTVGQLCKEVLRLPRINMQWEQALAVWAQHCMSADERRRRLLTHTLHSSTVRATTAAQKLCRQLGEEVEYSVEVSLPQYFTLPRTVTIPLKEDCDIPWENPADCGCVDIPLQFQADAAGKYECKMVLKSWCDTRVYSLEAMVTSQEESIHLDFTSPARRSVTQLIPLHNETQQDWKMQAGLCGEGFSGPSVLSVPAGTRVCYPLTFHPAAQHTVTGQLSLQNDCNGAKHVFTLRGVGERPLPVDHVLLHCPVGKTTRTQLNVPNYSQNKLSLKVVTDFSVVTGPPCLVIEPSCTAPYTLSVLPWKRGKQTGCVSFIESDDMQEVNENKENASACYEVHFSLEIICEPAAPIKVIDVQCVSMSSVAIEIPVNNPGGELLTLDVYMEGGSLSGATRVSVPPREALIYKASFSPRRVRKCTGSVLFQSEAVGEFWYQLQLYALPPPVITEPPTCCQLGKWTRLSIPLVNPTTETLQLTVQNSNPRNYTLEMDSGDIVTVEPQSSSQLGVRFSPSAIGEGNHKAKITFTCPQLQEWCVLLSGRGLAPQSEVPLSVSSAIGSTASITIPFTNPTKLPATLSVTLTADDPSGAPSSHPVRRDDVFSVALSQTQGVLISEGDSLDVPVVFAPKSVELQQAWLCISMEPIRRLDNGMRSESERSTICWTYPLCGIPAAVAAEDSELGVLQCEAGCQLVKKVDVRLTGCVLGNEDRRGQGVVMEDFQCEVLSDGEAERREAEEDCLSASVGAARRDPENGIITLNLNLVYTPLRACRSSAVVAVQSVSGKIWKFPISLVATQPQVDDVIFMETTKLGQTSAVGFRLTSTTRRSERFTAALLPGSSSEFTVTPLSGTLPPAGSTGALITVTFSPTAACNRHRATLSIQAADMRWTYEVKGESCEDSPSL